MKCAAGFLMCLVASLLTESWTHAADPSKGSTEEPKEISYYRHIRPIFTLHCQGCHQPARSQGKYVMTSHSDLLKKTQSDAFGIVPGTAPTESQTPSPGGPGS